MYKKFQKFFKKVAQKFGNIEIYRFVAAKNVWQIFRRTNKLIRDFMNEDEVTKEESQGKAKFPETAERFVLFADIMGFKDRVMRIKHEDLKRDLLELTKWSRLNPLKLGDHLCYSQFSDSILVVTDGVRAQQANLITQAGVVLMQECLERGFPLKGAIAQGESTYDGAKQLFFGQPLVDAYLLQESVKYYGIVLHHTAEQVMRDTPKVNRSMRKWTRLLIMAEFHIGICVGRMWIRK